VRLRIGGAQVYGRFVNIDPFSRRTSDKHTDPLELSGTGLRSTRRIVAKLSKFSGGFVSALLVMIGEGSTRNRSESYQEI
jgi:hypothetical protein